MSSIFQDLFHAIMAWQVYSELRPQQSYGTMGYVEFLHPVGLALLDSVVMACSRIVDDTRTTMSMRKLLQRFRRRDKELVELDKRLAQHEHALEK